MSGDSKESALYAGAGVGRIKTIRPVRSVIDEIVTVAAGATHEIQRRVKRGVQPNGPRGGGGGGGGFQAHWRSCRLSPIRRAR